MSSKEVLAAPTGGSLRDVERNTVIQAFSVHPTA
jgi:hypothetical protein